MIQFNKDTIKDKIYACWLGKNIGGTMGTPYEGRTEMQDIQGFSTPEGTVLPNDDLDLQLIWLKAIEEYGPYNLSAQVLGEYWVSFITPHWNEYGLARNNMQIGLIPPMSGEYKNEWKHSNGAWIRTEVWACMAPGCPDVAMKYAQMDACIDHGAGEGTYAAMFVAAIEAAAFVITDFRALVDIGLSKIPADSWMARTVRFVLECKEAGMDWKETREKVVEFTADLGWFQAPLNVAFVLIGMLWGENDFKKSMIIAINCGDDTDCTGATLGSLFGILYGTAGIPDDWKAHIGDNIVTISINLGDCERHRLPHTCTELTNYVFDMIPIVAKANRTNIRLGDADAWNEHDLHGIYSNTFAKALVNIPGYSYEQEFIWGKARVILPDGPDIAPGKTSKVKIEVFNLQNGHQPKYIRLKWHLPEGWTVNCPQQTHQLGHYTRYTTARVMIEAEITAGDLVAPTNRAICEITSPSRPTAGLLPIVFIG